MLIFVLLGSIYGLLTLVDCLITFNTVKKGFAKELNPIIRKLLKKPIIFVLCELVLLAIVLVISFILWDNYRWAGCGIMSLAVVWKTWLVVSNLNVIGGN